MALLDTGYKHWMGSRSGIWGRRLTIASNGIRGCLSNKWLMRIVMLGWVFCLIQFAILFCLGQLLVKDSIILKGLGMLGPMQQGIGGYLLGWLESNPQISVHTLYNVLFYFFSIFMSTLAYVALAICIPHLITRDLGSNAILVYSSKAVNKFDYLLGKFMTLFGVLSLVWLAPLCVSWFVGNALSPNWNFFWHSRMALLNVLLYVGGSILILSLVGLGISAISSKEKTAVSIWVMFWIFGGFFVSFAAGSEHPWLAHFSISYNLDQLALMTFNFGDELTTLQANIPRMDEAVAAMRGRYSSLFEVANPDVMFSALAIMAAVSILIIIKRVRPE